jgi:oligopeptide transport system substrate-binding protein
MITRRQFARNAAALAALAAAGAAPALAQASGYTILRRGNQNEPQYLDPNKATGSWETNIIGDLFQGLTTEDPDARPIPGAAESWTTSPDGLVWTFKLRAGAAWSDGVPVTADDFVFSMRRVLDPATAAEYASILYVIKNAALANAGTVPLDQVGVRAIDPLTLELTLETPAAYLLELLMHTTSFPVPRHVVEMAGNGWTAPGTMVSNGPYMLADWQPNAVIQVLKNPSFFDADSIAVDEVLFYPTDDAAGAVKRFRSGELDVNVGFPAQQADWLKENMPEAMRVATVMNVRYIAFNTSVRPFDDAKVRLALSMAVDRETIARDILKSGETAAWAIVPPGIANYGENPPQLSFAKWPLERRLGDAKLLLTEAGFSDANPLAFTFRFIGDDDSRRMAAALQEMWSKIGVKAELSVSEKKAHYTAVRAGDFQVCEANWFADFNDAVNFLFLARPSSGQMNISKYQDQAFETMILEAEKITDVAARAAKMQEAERYMLEAAPITPVFFGVSRNLVAPYVKGWNDNLLNVHRTRWLTVER